MKKIFSASLVLLLMFSTMSFSTPVSNYDLVNNESDECEDRANIVMHQALGVEPDMPIDELTWYMNAAYALCKGYTMEQILSTY